MLFRIVSLTRLPKYRKSILEKPEVKQFLEEQIHIIAATKGFEVLALEVMPDHLHLFVSASPFDSPTEIVKVFKGVTALRLFKKFPELTNQFWKGKLWSPSYYVGTAGHVSPETISDTSKNKPRKNAIHHLNKLGGLLADLFYKNI